MATQRRAEVTWRGSLLERLRSDRLDDERGLRRPRGHVEGALREMSTAA